MATATRIASPNLLDTLEDEPRGLVPSPFPVYHVQSQLDLDQEVPQPFHHASAVVQEHVEPVNFSFSLLPLPRTENLSRITVYIIYVIRGLPLNRRGANMGDPDI